MRRFSVETSLDTARKSVRYDLPSEANFGSDLQLSRGARNTGDHTGRGLADGRTRRSENLEIEDIERFEAKLDGTAFA